MSKGDGFVLFLLVTGFAVWGWVYLRKWLGVPRRLGASLEMDEEIPVTDAVALLEASGYEVMTLKRKIPVSVMLDDDQELHSRLFVDHFARKDSHLYIVKLARERRPLAMTGSGIRDALLVYQLIYKDAAGVLYVDADRGQIHKIRFELDY